MKSLEELEHLNLEPAAKKQVAAMLQAKDFKIEALTLEIAYYRRIRYGVKRSIFCRTA